MEFELLQTYRRTDGSQHQKLVVVGDKSEQPVYRDTTFYHLASGGSQYFGKRPHSIQKLRAEVQLLRAIDHPHALQLLDVHPRFGMISRYFPGVSLERADLTEVLNLRQWHAEVVELIDLLARQSVLDKIDVHANNILLNVRQRVVVDWLLIDFERCEWARRRTADFLTWLDNTLE